MLLIQSGQHINVDTRKKKIIPGQLTTSSNRRRFRGAFLVPCRRLDVGDLASNNVSYSSSSSSNSLSSSNPSARSSSSSSESGLGSYY